MLINLKVVALTVARPQNKSHEMGVYERILADLENPFIRTILNSMKTPLNTNQTILLKTLNFLQSILYHPLHQ